MACRAGPNAALTRGNSMCLPETKPQCLVLDQPLQSHDDEDGGGGDGGCGKANRRRWVDLSRFSDGRISVSNIFLAVFLLFLVRKDIQALHQSCCCRCHLDHDIRHQNSSNYCVACKICDKVMLSRIFTCPLTPTHPSCVPYCFVLSIF